MTDPARIEVCPPKLDIHNALASSVRKSEKPYLETKCYRVNPARLEIANEICLRNNTTVSAFLRECLEMLITDYGLPPEDSDEV